jgi:hypothetical protein
MKHNDFNRDNCFALIVNFRNLFDKALTKKVCNKGLYQKPFELGMEKTQYKYLLFQTKNLLFNKKSFSYSFKSS